MQSLRYGIYSNIKDRQQIWIVCSQAVCVTTHKGSLVKLLLCLISIVTWSSSHLVREMNQTQGSKN